MGQNKLSWYWKGPGYSVRMSSDLEKIELEKTISSIDSNYKKKLEFGWNVVCGGLHPDRFIPADNPSPVSIGYQRQWMCLDHWIFVPDWIDMSFEEVKWEYNQKKAENQEHRYVCISWYVDSSAWTQFFLFRKKSTVITGKWPSDTGWD